MNITGKYVKDGVLLGFEITEENTYSAPPMSLYLEPYMQILTQSGYSYYDYEPSHITLPNGESIMSVPDKEYTDEVRTEIALAKRSFSNILSDAQACKYYTQKVDRGPAIEFIQYPGPFEVNTREELESYVTAVERAMSKNPCAVVIRPLNTVVNPEAWFTPEELLTSTNNLYQRLLSLRKWANYEHYMLTCDFLAEQGVAPKGDYSLRAMMQGWYAYGPDLIKGKYLSSGFALKADGSFYNNDHIVPVGNTSENASHRNFTVGAYNTKTGKIWAASGESADADGTLSFDRGKRQPIWVHDTVLNRLKVTETDCEVLVTPSVGIADVSDRFSCTVEYNGRVYDTRFDRSRCMVGYGTQKKHMDVPMMIGTAIRGDYIPIWRINSKNDYKKYLAAQLYAIVHSQRMVEEPVDSSNSSYLKGLNMGIIGMINKYCTLKDENAFRLDIIKSWDEVDLLAEALSLYVKPIPAYILDTFNIEEADSKESFLAQVDIDEYVSKLIEAEEAGGEVMPTYIPTGYTKEQARFAILKLQSQGITHEPYNYYCFIKLVHDVIHSGSTFGCFEEGARQDAVLKMDTATNAILAVVNAVKGADCSIEEFSYVVDNLGTYVNLRSIYRPRDAAAVGYVRDFARDAEDMYSETTPYWMYVSRVYRELSNKPVEEQRPYLLEVIAFSAVDKQDRLLRDLFIKVAANALNGKSIVPDYNYEKQFEFENNRITSGEELSQKFAGYIGATLLFKCLIGVKTGRINTAAPYTESFTLFEDCPITVTVPDFILQKLYGIDVDAHRKYITTETYCSLETDSYAERCRSRLVCVNAEITPWSVTPLKGYSLKSYPLLQNYYDRETLCASFGEERTTALSVNKIKVAGCLRDTCKNTQTFISMLTGSDASIVDLHDLTLRESVAYDDLNCLLTTDFAETVDAYVKRWSLAKEEAKAMGKTLLSIPLKQDVLYGEIGTSLGYDITTEPVFVNDDSVKTNFLSDVVLPIVAKTAPVALPKNETVTLSALSVENIDEDIANNIMALADLPILPAIEYYKGVFTSTGRVGYDWVKDNFIKIGDKKWIGRLQTGYYVLEEV